MLDNFGNELVKVFNSNLQYIGELPFFKVIELHENAMLIRGSVWFTDPTFEDNVKKTITEYNNHDHRKSIYR
jgi:hypothetical protein